MKILALEDLEGLTSKQIISHLIEDYSKESNEGKLESKSLLKDMKVLIAYEHVGSFGCDSESFFLLQNRLTKELFEIHGSHCSCYGFEEQLNLEQTNKTALLFRIEKSYNNSVFNTGGYDDNSKANINKVNQYINKLDDLS